MIHESAPLRPVYSTVVTCGAVGAVYGLLGVRPPTVIVVLLCMAPMVSVGFWVQNDAPVRRVSLVNDWGLFVYLFWPILVPWYVIKTRGGRAWTFALLLLAAVVTPVVLTLAAAAWRIAVSNLLQLGR